MSDVAEVRRRVQRLVAQSREAAADRRARTAVAERDGERVLAHVVAPVFKTVAMVLKAEGYSFRVSTPAGVVRMAVEGSGENFVELVLDTADDPSVLRGRMSRARGRRVTVEEKAVREDSAVGSLTEADVLEFLLGELGPFLER